ncbi:helix-turn-helix domain-containing protein [Veillonella ratti]|uniref:helix-turn-helix domain-containing protein n=1 Tax=Veillonella ratti TaxID=103892 RepID=UPI000F8EAE46|nr:helix-turn-helix domain-containing protein [Veillonella ratti]
MTFGETLYNLRTTRKVTQSELADYLKISKSLISMYERNQRKPSFEILEGIADFFNVDMNTLHGINNSTSPQNNFTQKDERDIQKRLQNILDDLDDKSALNFFNGDEEMDEETKELLRISLESSIRLAKSRAKQKFTPNKYKNKDKED